MSTIASAADLLRESSGGDFLSAEEKEALFSSGTPFYIVGAQPKEDTRFGDQTMFQIRSKEAFGEEQRTLALKHNSFRENLAKNIAVALANGVQAAGPFWLGKFTTNSGHTAWDMLAEKPAAGTTRGIAEGAPAAAAASNAPTDDSLPF